MITPEEYEKLQEISALLNEAYEHYFSYEGHCKSYEGTIQIDFGNYWGRTDDPTNLTIQSVHISSYVFCTQGRHEYFDSVDEALQEVRKWHANEMAYDPNTPEEIEMREYFDAQAAELLTSLMEQGKLEIHLISDEDLEDNEKR